MRTLPLLTLAIATSAPACLNDRDTLLQAMQKFPTVVDAIVGRFDRNPPLYYQMRIKRLEPTIARDPANLQNYDDIAVAYDRIGQDEKAIAWIEKKKAQLDRLGAAAPNYHLYSYHANLGTFQAHLFLHKGAKRSETSLAEQGQKHIARAIEIKPDAHFNREPVQLEAIKWVISMSQNAGSWRFVPRPERSMKSSEVIEGLAGLVVLGAAWESPDIMQALDLRLNYGASRSAADLARMRASELETTGHPRLAVKFGYEFAPDSSSYRPSAEFTQLRKNAIAYDKHRTTFMLAKLRQGLHPDTDPNFWDGYREVPRYQPPWTMNEVWSRLGFYGQVVVVLSLLATKLSLIAYVTTRISRRVRLARQVASIR